ncbi:hypothetical protein FGM00_13520 [Aggregatimonas sangjinii]|uniref:Uncharacterized protein n=1 Tax=Aggregatimonas sangjinii TaxID=2583587 RepID=A0A5B7SWL7_9FLAO|nr:hypothetical protein [Aggregatimonas sangjinii]QCX01084.1 hypothetical protein FGM00_13520 [Aggregatimonas sangjinii]
MKANVLLLSFLFIGSTSLIAQVTQSSGDVLAKVTTCGDIDALFTHSGASMHNLMYADVNASKSSSSTVGQTKGSPYLVSSFEKSDIYKNDELLGSFYTRYNIYSKELEVKKTLLAEEQFKALLKDENIKAVFKDKEIQYVSFIDEKGKKRSDYLISKTSGDNYKLFQRMECNFVEGKKAENSMVNAIPNRFTNSSSYYLKNQSTAVVSYLPTKKSQLLKLFKENDKMQLANLIKKKGLNLKKENDLVALFEFANTLDQENYTVKSK